tara:strand:+ start:1090 stop:1734 length:645 start_codon:yes stop_codon:yes gene_type:complete
MNLSGNDLKIACLFIKYNNFFKEMFFSHEWISDMTDISIRTVQSCLINLKDKNIISWETRQHKSNIYTINPQWLITPQGKEVGKNYRVINTSKYINNKNIINEPVKKEVTYVATKRIQYEIQKITKFSNANYKKAVDYNRSTPDSVKLEKKAWNYISEMEGTKREQLLKEIGSDTDKWNRFVIAISKIPVYKKGWIKNDGISKTSNYSKKYKRD